MNYNSTSKIKYYTIGFYNLENLFDTENDPNTLDDDFTESSEKNWTLERYFKKIKKLGKVISKLGFNEIQQPPVIIGVAEVENSEVLYDLTTSKHLKNKGYDYIQYDSPDERGIDTALLFRKDIFTVLSSEAIPLYIKGQFGERDYTRDILYVKGSLDTQTVHVLVNHWPSRRTGGTETEYKRIAAAEKNREIIAGILSEEPDAKIIIMGDFNDDPSSKSISKLIAYDFYNPMELLLTYDEGSLNFRGRWNLFDQIIISNNFLKPHNNCLQYVKSKVYNPIELQEYTGKYKGNPFRTYIGDKYLGGYSDHFPVYEVFSIKKITF